MNRMRNNLMTMLNEGIEWVNTNKNNGCICPCCGQIAKTYKRKLNSGMAVELINLYKLSKNSNDQWHHHSAFASVKGGEISKLLYWGLVEEMSKDSEQAKTKTSGYWSITQKGKMFVTRKIMVEKHIYVFDTKLLGFSDEYTDIVDSLGSKFNYQELINEQVNL